MIAGKEALAGLKSSKIQLEVALICLRRKQAEMEKRHARLSSQPADTIAAARLAELNADLAAIRESVARGEQSVQEVHDRISRTSRQAIDESLEELLVANSGMSEELDALRTEMLLSLCALAEPLRRYQELADRKGRLIRKLAGYGKDLAYPNYLDCSLLRQTEYDDDLRFVVEAIKRLRVVA